MKIKQGFVLRTLGSEQIVAGEKLEQINFSKLISLNPTAAYLWQQVVEKPFDAPALAALLVKKYGIAESSALTDAEDLITSWRNAGLTEE
ncbi:MAG: PqqD family protein [Bacteroides sp.]